MQQQALPGSLPLYAATRILKDELPPSWKDEFRMQQQALPRSLPLNAARRILKHEMNSLPLGKTNAAAASSSSPTLLKVEFRKMNSLPLGKDEFCKQANLSWEPNRVLGTKSAGQTKNKLEPTN
jgi:hypothetical protein